MLAAALAGAVACAEPAEPEAGDPTLRVTLATTTDPVAASQAARELASESCAGLTTALALLDRRAAEGAPLDAATFHGLVDDATDAARTACPVAEARAVLAPKLGAAPALARARLADPTPAAGLAALATAPPTAAVLRERARWLLAGERAGDAARALALSLALEDDAETRARLAQLWLAVGDPAAALRACAAGDAPELRRARAAALAALSRYDDAAREVASAPVHLRAEVADAATGAATDVYGLAAASDAPPELLVAAAARAGANDPASAAGLLARAARAAPGDALIHAALAEAREASGDAAGAVAAWDRAAALSSGETRSVLAPIRILAEHGDPGAARRRARDRAKSARASKSADELHVASLAASYAGDDAAAVALGRAAVAARPGDGRLQLELAARLDHAGRATEAAGVLAALLVCGAHGRPWHRHEIAKRLATLDGAAAALAELDCEVADEADLAPYLERIPDVAK